MDLRWFKMHLNEEVKNNSKIKSNKKQWKRDASGINTD
jgi:hypothetical protein